MNELQGNEAHDLSFEEKILRHEAKMATMARDQIVVPLDTPVTAYGVYITNKIGDALIALATGPEDDYDQDPLDPLINFLILPN